MQRIAGFTLIEVLVSIFLIGVMLVAFQAVLLGTPLAQNAEYKNLALTIAKNEIEELRADGYALLPASGPLSNTLLTELPEGAGNVTVTALNAKTKQVVVEVSWKERGTDQSLALTTLITETGGL